VSTQSGAGKTKSIADRVGRKTATHVANRQCRAREERNQEPVNNKAAKTMNRKKTACAQRLNASHVVEAELEHLDWATRQPAQRMLDACYWRRRVLAVKCGFELTELQVMRLEKILQRLGHSTE
jgi:hypothetical protein